MPWIIHGQAPAEQAAVDDPSVVAAEGGSRGAGRGLRMQ